MEPIIGDDTVCVAVGRDIDENKLTLAWALEAFPREAICILHVHQRSKTISSITEGFEPSSLVEQDELRKIANDMRDRVLDEYLLICRSAGKRAEKLHIEMDDVAKGIVELVRQHKIKDLVMGAAANKHYSEQMSYPKSEKALYVKQHVPPCCAVWFVCSGELIYPRLVFEVGSSSVPSSSSSSYVRDSTGMASNLDLTVFEGAEDGQCGESYVLLRSRGNPDIPEVSSHGQLKEALLEAEKKDEEALEELVKRMEAQRSARQAVLSEATKFERLYAEEFRRRRQAEAEIEKMKHLRDEEKLREREALLENRAASSDRMKKEFEDKISSLMQQLELCKNERDDLKVKLADAHQLNDQILGRQDEETSSLNMQEFRLSDVHKATNDCDPSMKIGEGINGSIILKGLLYHTQVAIKVLHSEAISEFQQEVDILSKLRHPNIVTLIGACPDILALIYEYFPNGSLEDRLSCKDDSPPLSWKTRIHIASDLCSVLYYLHSSGPHKVVHGNLRPENIFLDANFFCKISEIGIFQALSHHASSSSTTPYHDPQYYTTGESPSSSWDIYSFGIILLRLLTGRSPQNIAQVVQDAFRSDLPCILLDTSAGDWPFSEPQAAQLIRLALRCCDISKSRRPDLEADVLPVLEQLKASSPSVHHTIPDDNRQPPSYFSCPILQDVMKEPHVAADGFTYEKEALSEWLSRSDTSPMTNLPLSNRTLIPNLALRSAIQEWMEQHP